MYEYTHPTFVSVLLQSMINLFKGAGAEYSIDLCSNQLGNCLAQRLSITTSEKVPAQGFMILGGVRANHLLKYQ